MSDLSGITVRGMDDDQGKRQTAADIRDELLGALKEVPPPALPIAQAPDSYRQVWTGGRNGVNADRAVEAARTRDVARAFQALQRQVVLGSKLIRVDTPYSVVTVTTVGGPGLPSVDHAFRVPGADPVEPVDAFCALLERFGVVARFGGLVDALFVARLSVPMFDSSNTQMIEVPDAARLKTASSSALIQMVDGTLEMAWAFVIDTGSYSTARL